MAAPGLAAWLRRVAPRRARGTLNIALVSDRQIQALNRTFRGIDRVTDVLSFPSAGLNGPSHITGVGRQSSGDRRSTSVERPFQGRQSNRGVSAELPVRPALGDIAIARGVAQRQARRAGHAEAVEWRVLALHGLLHVLGYDHERDDGRMQRVERALRRKGGLREGLIDRAR